MNLCVFSFLVFLPQNTQNHLKSVKLWQIIYRNFSKILKQSIKNRNLPGIRWFWVNLCVFMFLVFFTQNNLKSVKLWHFIHINYSSIAKRPFLVNNSNIPCDPRPQQCRHTKFQTACKHHPFRNKGTI